MDRTQLLGWQLNDIIDKRDKEIERLRETLELYALKRNYYNVTTDIVHKCGVVEWDMGKRAQQVLKGKRDG
ncbi:hypothetical protein LCGC14_1977510 [marine sediment metagenome]|uniref:Uncharacterized protein n=1 Tax=marine sediment metagenome TaxID=412755 RepID=A0A0F9FA68_9ZZZZ